MALTSRLFRTFMKQKCSIRYRSERRKTLTTEEKSHVSTLSWSIYGTNSPYYAVSTTWNLPGCRIAFNCGEGMQRLLFAEDRLPSSPIRHIFITRIDWRTLAGLPGTLIWLNECKLRQFNVYGPSQLSAICKRYWLEPNSSAVIKTFDCDDGYECVEKLFRIRAVPLRNSSDKCTQTIAYVGECSEYRTKPDVEKCVDLNVTSSQAIIQLSKGFDVTADDGKLVRATDVSAFYPKSKFLVVDIPTAEYLHHLFNPEIQLKSTDGEEYTVFHLTPSDIVATQEYQNYLQAFPNGTVHLVPNANLNFSGHFSSHVQQMRFHRFHPEVFPQLRDQPNCAALFEKDPDLTKNVSANGIRIIDLVPSRLVESRPTRQIVDHLPAKLEKMFKGYDSTEAYEQAFEEFRKLYDEHTAKHPISERNKEFPKIIFLGTGASCPTPRRNVTGILVRLREDSSILLDCGEGTLGQLHRFYGDQTSEILRTINAIFISHLHADHYMGLFSLLSCLKRTRPADSEPVLLMVPPILVGQLQQFNDAVEDLGDVYKLVFNTSLFKGHRHRHEVVSALELNDLQLCLVQHIAYSCGISLSVRRPHDDSIFKLTFSGDTTPCDRLVNIGANSTVLIHEATLEDDHEDMAKQKKHSTISEAIEQGDKMNAKHTILTHFSTRYRALPRIVRPLPSNVTIAFDNMELTESDLTLTHHFYHALKTIYQESMDKYDALREKQLYWDKNLSSNKK